MASILSGFCAPHEPTVEANFREAVAKSTRELATRLGQPMIGIDIVGHSDIGWLCNGRSTDLPVLENNAVFCSNENLIIADMDFLGWVKSSFGAGALNFVAAHEVGHAYGSKSNGFLSEMEADCLSGTLLDVNQLNQAYGFLSADTATTSMWFEPGSHGTGVDRIYAVLIGRRDGADGCYSVADLQFPSHRLSHAPVPPGCLSQNVSTVCERYLDFARLTVRRLIEENRWKELLDWYDSLESE